MKTGAMNETSSMDVLPSAPGNDCGADDLDEVLASGTGGWNPSQTSPARPARPLFTPATWIGISGKSIGPPEKKSVRRENE